VDSFSLRSHPDITEAMIRNWIVDRDLEIIVMIEGTESVTSNSLQARYSYTSDDIEYNMTFRPCVSINEKKQAVIDFNKFQELLSLDPHIDYHGDIFIQSII
jgi:singapore isolate B (sub-type 7) whole genome shotgun sequence assembly, scaffold_4